ncbi:MAG TPA: PspC domain-containing protein [Candidatus Paceibacterota bacterium]|nr:PspC domain-containing protein [Candidatus Paceibacterota bacterium]
MKKLYRSSKNRIIGGVAGGIAEYFDIDPILVRLLCVGLVFSGAFLIAYLAAWIFVPLGPSSEAHA